MTLHATRSGDEITVHGTYGGISVQVKEKAAHVGHFWHQLGELLQEAEKPPVYVENVELPLTE